MSKQKLIEALDATINALTNVKESLQNSKAEMDKFIEECVDALPKDCAMEPAHLELLANRLAWSYSTMHPEYRVDSQFKNLGDMIAGSKISYVINWVKKKGVEGLENFFNLSLEEQRKELQIAMQNYEDKIKDVFTKRFSQQ